MKKRKKERKKERKKKKGKKERKKERKRRSCNIVDFVQAWTQQKMTKLEEAIETGSKLTNSESQEQQQPQQEQQQQQLESERTLPNWTNLP